MTNVSGKHSSEQSEQSLSVSSGQAHELDDGPADRPSGAIEDGIVSSTANPADGRTYGSGKAASPGDAESVLPPYEGRKESTQGHPGRDEDETTKNTGSASDKDESTKLSPGEGSGDEGVGSTHTPGTGRAEDKL